MFEELSKKLDAVLSSLKGKTMISEESFGITMNTVSTALLDADVSLEVVKHLIKQIKGQVVGQRVIKKISPSKMIIKIFEDELTKVLGITHEAAQEDEKEQERPDRKNLIRHLDFNNSPPTVIMMVGLQGCGKTTTSGKLALILKNCKKTVVLASVDTERPAARKQLEVVAKQIGASSLPITENKKEVPIQLAKDALKMAQEGGYDVLILDTAGRMHIDQELMNELQVIKKIVQPREILLVADSLIGQDAAKMAKEFNDSLGITGVILTRVDGDSRGGAALSICYTTGKPVKFLGSGESLKDLDPFNPRRVARRILGMGDVVSLVEKAYQVIDEGESDKISKQAMQGKFDFNDLKAQLRTLDKLGGIGAIMKFIPGMSNMKLPGMMDESIIKRHMAIIDSMTKHERSNPALVVSSSRKMRITNGSGTSESDFHLLINQFRQASKMVKHINKVGIDKVQSQNILDMFSNKKK